MKNHHHHSSATSGLEKTATLDAFAHDTQNDILILAMFETRPWDLGELQLFQLQEKLNAYVSFILDGEMLETFPHFKDKPVRIELRTLHEPNQQALDFLGRVKEQLSHQQIDVEVVLIEENFGGCCGGSGSSCCEGSDQQCCCDDEECCNDEKKCCGGTDEDCTGSNDGSCCKGRSQASAPQKNSNDCCCS